LKDGEASGGIIVPIDDVQAFATALGRVLDDGNLRRNLAVGGLERAKAFAHETIGKQLRDVLFADSPSIRPALQDNA
jgi:glycosyltransferase involved in cell wall biosynthesis